MRALVISHAHPDFSLGGGEIAAYNLYNALQEQPQVEACWFLARVDKSRGATGHISLRRPNEYLWEQSVADWHVMRAAHAESLSTWFSDLITALSPTHVFSHHFAHLGLEHYRVIKRLCPEVKIILTLHEYIAICSNNGQMIKKGTQRLCDRSSYDDCSRCFPDKTPEDFWLRKHAFQRAFDYIDHFVSPSAFLKGRFVDWGIAEERITVIENGQLVHDPVPVRSLRGDETRNRFGYFGQINPFKGLHVVLEALSLMTPEERRTILVEVHGANLEVQEADFKAQIETQIAPLIADGCLSWVGPYQPHEIRSRIRNVDWFLVPSIWWENSPMVIQEAFIHKRPVICSDIGGMAEKVEDGVTGFHVPAGNPLQWRNTLLKASTMSAEWDQMSAKIPTPISQRECAARYIDICDEVGDEPSLHNKKALKFHDVRIHEI